MINGHPERSEIMVISQAFIFRFLLSNVIIMLVTLVFFLMKRLFKKQIPARGQYQIWIIYLIMLTIPFLPFRNRTFFPAGFLNRLSSNAGRAVDSLTAAAAPAAKSTLQIQDYALEAEKSGGSTLLLVLSAVWLLGACLILWHTARSAKKLHQLFKTALPVQNKAVRTLYKKCLKQCGQKRPFPLLTSAFIQSPVSARAFRPCIILPMAYLSEEDSKALSYILLHEIQHCRRRDHAVNLFMNLFCIIYWFNPAVWLAGRKMRADRELACDASVLGILQEGCYREYGSVLLHHTANASRSEYSMTTGFAENQKQMKKRILGIVTYRKETGTVRIKNTAFLFLAAILVLANTPFLSVTTWGETVSTSPKGKTKALELDTFFEGYAGSFVLYQPSSDTWSIYGEEESRTRISPDSTYKIYSALLALEKGTITPDSSILSWKEEVYPFESWNQDQDLKSAMKNSVNWYFQELDSRAGLSSIQGFLDQIGYGNSDVSAGPETFWMESSLKISPIEQVRLLADLYDNTFGFQESSIQAVKEALCIAEENGYTLYGKTGTGNIDGKDKNGWFTGYVETHGVPSFFAVNIRGEDHADGATASRIALEILAQMQLLPD